MECTASAGRLRIVRRAALAMLTCTLLAGVGWAQEIIVQNGASAPVKITAGEIAAMPHRRATVESHGKRVSYEGVPLASLLEKAGVRFGETLRGKRLATYLLAEAADGYRVVFALPELDPAFTDHVILLADRADGHPLDNKEGPFRIVVPDAKRMARSVREVTALKILQAP